VLKYSSGKDLGYYSDAVFQVQQLQLRIDAMDHIADTVLPILSSLDPSTR